MNKYETIINQMAQEEEMHIQGKLMEIIEQLGMSE